MALKLKFPPPFPALRKVWLCALMSISLVQGLGQSSVIIAPEHPLTIVLCKGERGLRLWLLKGKTQAAYYRVSESVCTARRPLKLTHSQDNAGTPIILGFSYSPPLLLRKAGDDTSYSSFPSCSVLPDEAQDSWH